MLVSYSNVFYVLLFMVKFDGEEKKNNFFFLIEVDVLDKLIK